MSVSYPSPRLLEIYIAAVAGDPPTPVQEIEALAGVGLAGDRYAARAGSWSKKEEWWNQLTLIEAEALAAIAAESDLHLPPGAHRRNLVTTGVPLNHLVGRDFIIGPVRLRGIRLCEPCGYLDQKTQSGVKQALQHRGGLRASILTTGTLSIGQPISF